ncbi:MAG: ATP-binding protein [Sphingobacteriia bacterium]|nr:ATP-binding protein [Sphingobacteriia bacterium]
MNTQEILPWDNDELKRLLEVLISHGTETSKVDFKAEIKITTPEEKSELLKDITAIANTHDENNYGGYGFLIYGVKAKSIVGITETETNTDKFQNNIEQLLKTYIAPMPSIYVLGFKTDEKQWGSIIIPPHSNKPHMFFKDFSCTNPAKSRKKGEWFVRRGSTTDPGLPEDLSIIMQKQTELFIEPIRESMRGLQLRMAKIEEQYNSALFTLVENGIKSLSGSKASDFNEETSADIERALGVDLPNRLKQKLRTPKDSLGEDLITEAKTILNYIEGTNTEIPWIPQLNDSETNKKIITNLEEKLRTLQISIATIIINDKKGEYTDPLLRAIKILAKSINAPSGIQYNRIGEAIRYYPLYLIMYTVFICAVMANRGILLKQILAIPIKDQRTRTSSLITDFYFFSYYAKELFNDAFKHKWCEPISHRVRQIISDNINEITSEFSEAECFFRGEFVLSLVNIDKCINEKEQHEHQVPLGGEYLYYREASEVIQEFLLENQEWFPKLYSNPINEILIAFDNNSSKMAGSGCIASGLFGLNTSKIYNDLNGV